MSFFKPDPVHIPEPVIPVVPEFTGAVPQKIQKKTEKKRKGLSSTILTRNKGQVLENTKIKKPTILGTV